MITTRSRAALGAYLRSMQWYQRPAVIGALALSGPFLFAAWLMQLGAYTLKYTGNFLAGSLLWLFAVPAPGKGQAVDINKAASKARKGR